MSRTNKYGTPQPGELTAKQWAEKGYPEGAHDPQKCPKFQRKTFR